MQKDRAHNPTTRVLDILELLATAEDGLNLTALAVGTRASKSTLLPIVKTLTARDYIRQDPDTMRYFLGIKCLAMAEAANMGNAAWLNVIDKEMRTIVNDCDEACQLGVLEGTGVVFIAMVQSQRRGFTLEDRELTDETVCLAVPLSQRGHAIAALSVSIPKFQNSDEVRAKVLKLLFAAQQHIDPILDGLPAIKPAS